VIDFTFSELINIKILEKSNIEEFYDFIIKNREHLINWIPFVSKVNNIDDVKKYVDSYIEKNTNGIGVLYGIWENNKLIGSILIREMDKEAKWAEIGYMIDHEYQGKGITKRACKKLIDYIFDILLLEKVEICCDDKNIGSIKLAEALGFKLEGTIRNHMMVNNEIGNMRYYGLLRNERKS